MKAKLLTFLVMVSNLAFATYEQVFFEDFEGLVSVANETKLHTLTQDQEPMSTFLQTWSYDNSIDGNNKRWIMKQGPAVTGSTAIQAGGGNFIQTVEGKVATVAAGNLVRVSFDSARDTTEIPSNRNFDVDLIYWDAGTAVIMETFSLPVGTVISNPMIFTATVPVAANGKELGVKVRFTGPYGPAVDNVKVEIDNNPEWNADFSVDTEWVLIDVSATATVAIDTAVEAIKGRTPRNQNGNEAFADYAETKESNFIRFIEGNETVTISWHNIASDNSGVKSQYAVAAELFYWEDAATKVALSGSRYTSDAVLAQSSEFLIDTSSFPNAIGKKLGVKLIFLGQWTPSIDNLKLVVTPPESTPVTGLVSEITENRLSWSVESENGVKEYLILQEVDGEFKEYRRVKANGSESYSVEIESGKWAIQTVDKSGFRQTFSIESSSEILLNLRKGWNLVSLPFAQQLEESVFIWNNSTKSYETTEFVEKQQGFWLFATDEQILSFSGKIEKDSVKIEAGWNLIGPVENIEAPEGLVIYNWENSYKQAEILTVGSGYWIYADDPQQINL